MGKGHRTCEICGIKERHDENRLLFSSFPLELNRCREWVKVVGKEDLLYIPIEKLSKTRNVRANHFETKYFNKKRNRLKRDAIPTLNLAATPLSDRQLKAFPSQLHQPTEPKGALPEGRPSTSQQDRIILGELSQNELLPEAVPSTSQQQSIPGELPQIERTHSRPVKRSGEDLLNKEKSIKLSQHNITLTERERKLMKQLKKTKCTLASLRRSVNIIGNLDSVILQEIVASAIKNQKRRPKGRRWSTKNKVSALAIFKRSPKAYRYLQHLMPLPSVKTLHNVLKKVPMGTGVCKAVIEHLNILSKKKNKKDMICTLAFDEISLKRRLLYDQTNDKVEGFEDFGLELGRSAEMADHALVFMLQGVRAKFKQPIAFYLVKGTISSQKLAVIIKEIINKVEETKFKILATICDQGPTNMGALKILKTMSPPYNYNQNYFVCNGKKVYIIYDVPHLFKSIRNNFQNYGIMSMGGIHAKWDHLNKVEEKNRNLLYLSKITPMHVDPKYRAKMKVKLAAQILSNTVAAVLKLLAEKETDQQVSEEMMQTGMIIHDLDRLFDITNGPSNPDDVKKGIRENVSSKTDHIRLWVEYRSKLESVVFKNSRGIRAKNVRCIEGYITTLKSLRDIWDEVKAMGFKYLNLRQLNQDALENLFGVIRQHSPTNRNPTCYAFISALKTSIISGMTAPHTRGFNCEKDSKELLTDFHNIIFDDTQIQSEVSSDQIIDFSVEVEMDECVAGSSSQSIPVLSIPEEFERVENDLTNIDQQPIVYVSGYIASSILKNNECKHCENCLRVEEPEDDPIYNYITLREWWADKKSLSYPTKDLCKLVEEATKIFENKIVPILHHQNICTFTKTMFITECDTSFFVCEQHSSQILDKMLNRLALLLIRRQCEIINKNIILEEEENASTNKKAQQLGIAK